MERIQFKKNRQHAFMQRVMENTGSPSLRGLLQFGISTTYSALKNYYTERRLLSRALFFELCTLARIDTVTLSYRVVSGTWGQVKGGTKSRKTKSLKVVK